MCTYSDRSCMDTISKDVGKIQDTSACLRGDVLSLFWLVKYGLGEFVSVACSKCGRTTMLTVVGTKCRGHYAI